MKPTLSIVKLEARPHDGQQLQRTTGGRGVRENEMLKQGLRMKLCGCPGFALCCCINLGDKRVFYLAYESRSSTVGSRGRKPEVGAEAEVMQ